jgi:hypothetical protein
MDKFKRAWGRRKLRDAYRDTFKSPQGETVLADLVDFCCLLRPSYQPGDSHGTAYAEGMRSAVLRIFEMIDKDESHMRDLEKRRKQEIHSEAA